MYISNKSTSAFQFTNFLITILINLVNNSMESLLLETGFFSVPLRAGQQFLGSTPFVALAHVYRCTFVVLGPLFLCLSFCRSRRRRRWPHNLARVIN